jgi:hypothetical protein
MKRGVSPFLVVLLVGVVLSVLTGQDSDNAPHHRVAVVLTWDGSEWSALPSQIIPGGVQVYRNGLALADNVDYGYNMERRRFWFLAPTNPDDIILVTYDTR